MIQFFFEGVDNGIDDKYKAWLEDIIKSEGKKVGEINYIFCDDEYLLKVNQEFLQHDFYTDIITFDAVRGKTINGEIFVSLSRILDNSFTQNIPYEIELQRVLAHGILHLCGYKDKSESEITLMRKKEDEYIKKFEHLHF